MAIAHSCQGSAMNLLEETTWDGRIFTGQWSDPSGGEAAVVEPATGAELGRIGIAGAEDIARAGAESATAQRSWAATPFTERAAVLRRAGDLWTEHADELRQWLVREA